MSNVTATLAGTVSWLGQMAMWSSLFGRNEEDSGGGLAQVNPLAAFDGEMARMFSTHPPTGARVQRLEQLAHAA